MAGDARVRHCSECNLNVYNLSAMTEREIEQLVAAHQGRRLCARFYRRADGTILTENCPWSLRALARKASRIASAALAALMSVTLAAARSKSPRPTCECRQVQQKEPAISLTVMDSDGALIPNAQITLENNAGKEARTGSTGPSGEWTSNAVPPGEYRLIVKSAGFRTFVGAVKVQYSKLLSMKIKLPVGELKQTVEVTSTQGEIMGPLSGIAIWNSSSIPISPSGGGQRMPMR